MGDEPVRGALRRDLLGAPPERERLGLREDVGDEQVVVVAQGVEAVREAHEVARNQPRALVDELVEAVLAVGSGLAPVDAPVSTSTAVESSRTDLPFDSIVSCCR